MDFLIVDERSVLLSHVSSDAVKCLVKYLYIESKMVADIFTSLFDDCWRKSRDPNESDVCKKIK